jgi:hypothetical protein
MGRGEREEVEGEGGEGAGEEVVVRGAISHRVRVYTSEYSFPEIHA